MAPAPLGAAEPVHVWRIALDVDRETLEACRRLLDDADRARAAGMGHGGTRRSFIVTRAALRRVLAAMLGREPVQLRFATTATGKPWLPDDPHLQFSVAHAGDWALIAVTRAGPVGIDIEPIRPVPEMAAVAADLFTPEDQAALGGAPGDQRTTLFLRLWVAREALLKAVGRGFADPFPPEAEAWTVEPIMAPAGYVAALARPGGALPAVYRS